MAEDAPDGTETSTEDEPGWARNLRHEAAAAKKEADKLKAQLAERDRADAFKDAGIPDTPVAQKWAKAYDGDLDPAKIKALALEEGLLQQAPTTPVDEQDAHQRMQNMLHGEHKDGPELVNDVIASAHKAVLEAKSPEEIEEILDRFNLRPTIG